MPSTPWINAKNTQPTENDRYLVCIHRQAPENLGGNCRKVTILRWTETGWRMPVHFPKEINDKITEHVTHWQPLPPHP